jgi:hypothetical protein
MRQTLQSTAAAAIGIALGATALPAAAGTGIVYPAPRSNTFIQLYEIDSSRSACDILCSLVNSTGAPLNLPTTTLFGDPGHVSFLTASGSIAPDAMHAFSSGNLATELDLAMHDTYTVHGGSGPFSITATMHATGTASTLPAGPFQELVGANVKLTIGTYDIDPATTPFPGVTPFDPTTTALAGPFELSGSSAGSVPIDVSVSYTRIVNPGDVFDLGYEMSSAMGLGTIDVSHTALISFDTPDGVFLTSALGGEFGDVPGAPGGGVPEPASWALMIAGFGGIGAALRRRRLQAVAT